MDSISSINVFLCFLYVLFYVLSCLSSLLFCVLIWICLCCLNCYAYWDYIVHKIPWNLNDFAVCIDISFFILLIDNFCFLKFFFSVLQVLINPVNGQYFLKINFWLCIFFLFFVWFIAIDLCSLMIVSFVYTWFYFFFLYRFFRFPT
jgi:hypothetical protein